MISSCGNAFATRSNPGTSASATGGLGWSTAASASTQHGHRPCGASEGTVAPHFGHCLRVVVIATSFLRQLPGEVTKKMREKPRYPERTRLSPPDRACVFSAGLLSPTGECRGPRALHHSCSETRGRAAKCHRLYVWPCQGA